LTFFQSALRSYLYVLSSYFLVSFSCLLSHSEVG
jgi:hypothetical protein